MNRLAGCLAGLVGLWAAAAFAGEPLVLRVFNDFHTAADIGISPTATECRDIEPLIKSVMGPVFAEYSRQQGLSVGRADLREYCRKQLPADAVFTDVWREWEPRGSQWRARQRAFVELTVWKLQKSLFEQYGGRVIPAPQGQPQAFDAMVACLVEREQAGDFTLYDPRLKLRFWECLRTPKSILVPEAQGRALIDEHPADRRNRNRPAAP